MGFIDLIFVGLVYIGISSIALGLYVLRSGTDKSKRVAFVASLLNLLVAAYLFLS